MARLTPEQAESGERSRSLSPSPSPMARANSMLREISQRVVNLSNDSDMVEQNLRRKSSIRDQRRPGTSDRHASPVPDEEEAPVAQPPIEKIPSIETAPAPFMPVRYQNPLLGKSWGIFGPDNGLRKWLLEILVHPLTEPFILVLIIAQTVLLAVNAAADAVYLESRTKRWGSGFDYAIFGLFVFYTLELSARTVVSGFISNPREHSTINRDLGFKRAVLHKANTLFAGSQAQDLRPSKTDAPSQPSIVRAFTGVPESDGPGHSKHQQK
ncbi:calcium channel protein, partial [Exophiala xenobiotica]